MRAAEKASGNQQQLVIPICVDPSEINQKDIHEVERMLASHTWRVRKVSHEQAKIRISYSCTKCDTERVAFVEWIPKDS